MIVDSREHFMKIGVSGMVTQKVPEKELRRTPETTEARFWKHEIVDLNRNKTPSKVKTSQEKVKISQEFHDKLKRTFDDIERKRQDEVERVKQAQMIPLCGEYIQFYTNGVTIVCEIGEFDKKQANVTFLNGTKVDRGKILTTEIREDADEMFEFFNHPKTNEAYFTRPCTGSTRYKFTYNAYPCPTWFLSVKNIGEDRENAITRKNAELKAQLAKLGMAKENAQLEDQIASAKLEMPETKLEMPETQMSDSDVSGNL